MTQTIVEISKKGSRTRANGVPVAHCDRITISLSRPLSRFFPFLVVYSRIGLNACISFLSRAGKYGRIEARERRRVMTELTRVCHRAFIYRFYFRPRCIFRLVVARNVSRSRAWQPRVAPFYSLFRAMRNAREERRERRGGGEGLLFISRLRRIRVGF